MPYKLTPQNRISVPKHIHLHLGIKPGDKIDYCNLPDGSVRMTMFTGASLNTAALSMNTKPLFKL